MELIVRESSWVKVEWDAEEQAIDGVQVFGSFRVVSAVNRIDEQG